MPTGLVITSVGCEDISADEVRRIAGNVKVSKEPTCIKFDAEAKRLCDLCYRAQSAYRIMILLAEFHAGRSLHDIKMPDFNIEYKVKRVKSECLREGEHDFKSVDMAAEISKSLKKKGFDIDFDNPEMVLLTYIKDDKGYIGIDLAGFDLSKRHYKIFNHPESLKGITAYALVASSGYTGAGILLDPFMGSGIIVIEAALHGSGFPVQFYNKEKFSFMRYLDYEFPALPAREISVTGYDAQFRYLQATQKNAKLAGIDRLINLSKIDIEWLDTKFEKGTVDLIVTDPPRASKNRDMGKLNKLYAELFYQAAYVLKKKGKVVLLSRNTALFEEAAKKHKFKLMENRIIFQGKEEFEIAIFQRE